jgi:membrane-associated phospholipid phosphatase
MDTHFHNFFNKNPLVQAIHTVVKGRVRYKVNGLSSSESLKRYLEFRLSEVEGITQVRANHFTGNILIFFQPNLSLNAITSLLQDVVLDYKKQDTKLPVIMAESSVGKEKVKKMGSQLVLVSGAVSTLAFCTGLLYKYSLDKSILLAIQKLHTPLLDRMILGITFLGDPIVLLLICSGLIVGSPYYKSYREATTLSIAAVGAIALNCWLKMLFGRARPALWNRIINVGQHSFPSGHAMVSIVIYGFIGYILAKQFPQWRRQIFALTFILIVAIGFSRLYLGVHWPTDVAAGYASGLVWLSACIYGLEQWQKYRLSGRHSQQESLASNQMLGLRNFQKAAV